jgi:hypothetical protein
MPRYKPGTQQYPHDSTFYTLYLTKYYVVLLLLLLPCYCYCYCYCYRGSGVRIP